MSQRSWFIALFLCAHYLFRTWTSCTVGMCTCSEPIGIKKDQSSLCVLLWKWIISSIIVCIYAYAYLFSSRSKRTKSNKMHFDERRKKKKRRREFIFLSPPFLPLSLSFIHSLYISTRQKYTRSFYSKHMLIYGPILGWSYLATMYESSAFFYLFKAVANFLVEGNVRFDCSLQ